MKPYHTFMYNELHFSSLKKCLLRPYYKKRDSFLSTEWVFMEWLVNTPQKFLTHNATFIEPSCFKTVYMGKWVHSSWCIFSLEFLAKYILFYVTLHFEAIRMWFKLFVLALYEKWVVVMDTPVSMTHWSTPHEAHLGRCGRGACFVR